MKTLFMMLAFSAAAFAQACPGGFWGNGQCIGACESPMVNPNVTLQFINFTCQSQPPCENNYLYCYPEYNAWDNAYNQYCGVIIDWTDGGCYAMPPYLNQFPPKKQRSEEEPLFQHSFFRLTVTKRPIVIKARSEQMIQIHSKHFWWKHTNV